MFQRVLLDFVLKTFGLGAENETRTRDPNLGKVVLYQLSYFRISVCVLCCQALPLPRLDYIILLRQGCALPTELFPHLLRTLRHLYRFCECKYKANIFILQTKYEKI